MNPSKKKALYPGTFDPVTLGHMDLIQRGLDLFDHLTVGVAVNAEKSPLLTVPERVELLQLETESLKNVDVVSFQGLVVDYCKANQIGVILRGVRTISDFEYEYQMALTNRSLAPEIETVFVMPNQKYSFVSSRLIREILAAGGDVSSFISPQAENLLKNKIKR